MKTILLLIAWWAWGITASNTPYIHWELLSKKGEERLGDSSFVLHLSANYKTNKTDSVCFSNLQHGAKVLMQFYNHVPADTDRVHYPYAAYDYQTGFGGVNRRDGWVYISMKGLTDTVGIKLWMKNTNIAWNKGMKLDSTKNTATIYKFGGKASSW